MVVASFLGPQGQAQAAPDPASRSAFGRSPIDAFAGLLAKMASQVGEDPRGAAGRATEGETPAAFGEAGEDGTLAAASRKVVRDEGDSDPRALRQQGDAPTADLGLLAGAQALVAAAPAAADPGHAGDADPAAAAARNDATASVPTPTTLPAIAATASATGPLADLLAGPVVDTGSREAPAAYSRGQEAGQELPAGAPATADEPPPANPALQPAAQAAGGSAPTVAGPFDPSQSAAADLQQPTDSDSAPGSTEALVPAQPSAVKGQPSDAGESVVRTHGTAVPAAGEGQRTAAGELAPPPDASLAGADASAAASRARVAAAGQASGRSPPQPAGETAPTQARTGTDGGGQQSPADSQDASSRLPTSAGNGTGSPQVAAAPHQAEAAAALDAPGAPSEAAAAHLVELPERLAHCAAQLPEDSSSLGPTRLEIEIDPPELGHLRLQMRLSEGAVFVSYRGESPEVEAFLASNTASLRASLAEHGLTLGGFSLHGGGAGGHAEPDPHPRLAAPPASAPSPRASDADGGLRGLRPTSLTSTIHVIA